MSYTGKEVINGTWGEVWISDSKIAEIKSFQAKDEYEKEEVKMAGKMHTSHKIMAVSGKGSCSVHKVNSYQAGRIGSQVRNGKTPHFTIIAKLADPDSRGAERIAFEGVVFDDLTLMDWEVGTLGSVEMPFTYETYKFLDKINK